jgi:lysyl-tRNA synthetase class II
MSNIKNVTFNNIKNSNLTLGDQNLVQVAQRLSEVNQTSLTSESKDWQEVVKQLSELQEIVKGLPDEHEKKRDRELVPALSIVKEEAQAIAENPKKDKKGFVEKLKSFTELSTSIVGLGEKVWPVVKIILNLTGVPLP